MANSSVSEKLEAAAAPVTTLAEDVATLAETIVNTLKQTDYVHDPTINAAEGVYDCDCAEFVGYLLMQLAPAHYNLLPRETPGGRPRAFEYFELFKTLTPESSEGWHRIDQLADAERGDIISWRFPTIEKGSDTGHVLVVADTPKTNAAGVIIVRVYDSAVAPHFQDTRAAKTGGVGSGFVNFKVDAEGRPVSFQFAPADVFTTFPIMIGRLDTVAGGN